MTDPAGCSQPSRPSVSAAIIALNEERDIPACLESLTWCDEIIVVVDTATTDRTAALASDAGARVFHRAWEGWTPQKNFAFAQCRGTWILSVDADERLTPELRDEILATTARPEALDGYFVPRQNIWLGRWIRHGGWYPDYTLRLFRRGRGECKYQVHERIEVIGQTAQLTHPLVHQTVRHLDEHVLAALKATEFEVREMIANRMRFYWVFPWAALIGYMRDLLSDAPNKDRAYLLAKRHFKNRVGLIWFVPFSPLAKFLYMFVVMRGFKDGMRGLLLAALSAFYVFLKYAKYWAVKSSGTVDR